MRSNEQNATWGKERRQPRSFSLEEAFLTHKNYKVIFYIAFIISILRTVSIIPMLFEWKLTGWEGNISIVLLFSMEFILEFFLMFIPVAFVFVVRVIFTVLLNKKIDQLEQATWERTAAAYRQKSA
ncbi:hypothetical protein [Bartonella tribocorum]|uniref:hypothetical protein n=1 Tax=Bartonella tribocorum TaxID=85701 RepID=UPI00043AF5BB|nr:hypothetical protein [Bartonella tribocorum]CDO49586.1 hypothetical membrane protein [Bartonella tribocorum]